MPDPLISLLLGILSLGLLAWFFWPTAGLLSRWRKNRRITHRVLLEDALKNLQKAGMEGRTLGLQGVAGSLQITENQAADLLDELEKQQLVSLDGEQITLTPTGQQYAMHIIRTHRLWENYLAEKTGFKAGEWHSLADIREHMLTPEETDALSSQLGFPRFDPHGDPIPDAGGQMVELESQPLASLQPNETGRIVHIEDEPDSIAAQILAEGLEPGMLVRQTAVTPHRVRFWANGEEHVLAPIVAANISVMPVTSDEPKEPEGLEKLSVLQAGQSAEVVQISSRCRGAERRRLLDLGILPGTRVTAELKSPGGDPTAYRIRGAVIALREDQADLININPQVELSE
ncbi:MAG: DtxR family transcriptional regulator [Anaerolineae bacterium]|nr:DtxR family transcriptional regulator [Anaerolineae bacterium]